MINKERKRCWIFSNTTHRDKKSEREERKRETIQSERDRGETEVERRQKQRHRRSQGQGIQAGGREAAVALGI